MDYKTVTVGPSLKIQDGWSPYIKGQWTRHPIAQ